MRRRIALICLAAAVKVIVLAQPAAASFDWPWPILP